MACIRPGSTARCSTRAASSEPAAFRPGPSTISCLSPISCPFSCTGSCCSSRAFSIPGSFARCTPRPPSSSPLCSVRRGHCSCSRPTDRSLARKRCSLPPACSPAPDRRCCCWPGASPSRAAIQPPSSSTEHSPSPSDSASTVWCCIRSPSRGEAWQARSFPSRKSPCCSCFVAT